jgi:hypothetical protein
MRRIILATALVALAPFAYAQTNPGNMGGMSAPGTMGGMSNPGRSATSSAAPMTGQPDPENCGTPDEPRKCPPMPRRALQTFPANR